MAQNFDIFQSQYSSAQMENSYTNGVPRINPTNKHWERWDISTQTWVDTGVIAEAQTTGASWGQITGTLANQSDLNTALQGKQDTLTFDSTPTSGSDNPVKSQGIKSYVDGADGQLGNAIAMRGWNQIFTASAEATMDGITTAFNSSNGQMTCSGTQTNTFFFAIAYDNSKINIVANHKYFVKLHTTVQMSIRISNGASDFDAIDVNNEAIWTPVHSGRLLMYKESPQGTVINYSFYPQLIDLTELYGAGNEPTTVAEFRKLFPAEYYKYYPVNGFTSNRNLLDNPFFTIDQRKGYIVPIGVPYYDMSAVLQGNTTSVYKVDAIDSSNSCIFKIGSTNYYTPFQYVVRGYTGYGYTVDRWKCDDADGGFITVNNDGTLTVASTYTSGGRICLEQKFEKSLPEGDYMCTVDVAEVSGQWATGNGVENGTQLSVGLITYVYHSNGSNFNRLYIWKGSGNTTDYVKIRSIKLELGSISTLANDVAPNYAEELAKCQRYFYRLHPNITSKVIAIGEITPNRNNAWAMLNLPVPMRIQPSLTLNDQLKCFTDTWTNIYTSTCAIHSSNDNMIMCLHLGFSSSYTAGANVIIQTNSANTYLDFSADL